MREEEIKKGIQQICDLSKEISKCSDEDNNVLIDKLNNLHEEDFNLLGKRYDNSKPDDAVNFLRKVVLDFLREGKKLDKQKLEEFNNEYRRVTNDQFKIYQTDFYVFQPFTVSCYYHKPISEFIEHFVNEIIEALQINGQVSHTCVNYGNSAERRSKRFWLAIYNKRKNLPFYNKTKNLSFYNKTENLSFECLQFFVEFEEGIIRYGVNSQSDKHYVEGPYEEDPSNFDFKVLISFFEKNKELVLPDKSKVEIKEEIVKPVLDNTTSQNEGKSMKEFPRNIILYGPPGTGKTYNTVDIAVEIVTGAKASHQENKKVFDILREEGQIEFITFHQNYSYEDFMTGIRPDLEEASTLKFRRKEGIFYKMCKRAEQNYLQSQNKKDVLKPFKEIFSEFIEPLEKEEVEIEIKMNSGKSSFWITEINPSNLGFRKQSGGTSHTLSIDTIQGLYEGTRDFTSGLRAYYEPLINELWHRGRETTEKVSLNRYVLIIDEINRANISKVFGELITLLEEDKRLGAKNELKISIPSEEISFGIPPNVYVIGTMNTADKSIAMIDIALRRRFEFIGYFPDYGKVDELSGEILRHINTEIYNRKKSADYLIGHGYFMNGGEPPETSKVLQNKVIPLLMEYFSGKTDVVEDIFKGSEWSVKYDIEKYCWQIEH